MVLIYLQKHNIARKNVENSNFLSEGLLLTCGCSKEPVNTLSSDNLVSNQSDIGQMVFDLFHICKNTTCKLVSNQFIRNQIIWTQASGCKTCSLEHTQVKKSPSDKIFGFFDNFPALCRVFPNTLKPIYMNSGCLIVFLEHPRVN